MKVSKESSIFKKQGLDEKTVENMEIGCQLAVWGRDAMRKQQGARQGTEEPSLSPQSPIFPNVTGGI